MKKLNFIFILSLLFILLVSCSKENTQLNSLKSSDDVLTTVKSDHFVPFKGTFEVYVDEVIHYPPPPPKVQVALGAGNLTHLGNTDFYSLQSWFPPHAPPLIPPWTGTGYGEVIFTAANGDLLLADYTDATAYHESESLVFVTFTGHFKDGGTGRFEYVDGTFIWEVVFNPLVNLGTATCTGEIMY